MAKQKKTTENEAPAAVANEPVGVADVQEVYSGAPFQAPGLSVRSADDARQGTGPRKGTGVDRPTIENPQREFGITVLGVHREDDRRLLDAITGKLLRELERAGFHVERSRFEFDLVN